MKECLLFDAQNDCIAFLNITLLSEIMVSFVILWGFKELFILILKLMINR